MFIVPSHLIGRQALDREGEVGARADDAHPVGPGQVLHQRIHGLGHARVVHGADVEEEVLEGLLAHRGHLGHGRGGEAEHHPARSGSRVSIWTFFQMFLLYRSSSRPDMSDQARQVAPGVEADEAVHLLHARLLEVGLQLHLLGGRVLEQGPVQRLVAQRDEGAPAGLVDGLDEGPVEGRFDAGVLDEHIVARLHFDRIVDEYLSRASRAGCLSSGSPFSRGSIAHRFNQMRRGLCRCSRRNPGPVTGQRRQADLRLASYRIY